MHPTYFGSALCLWPGHYVSRSTKTIEICPRPSFRFGNALWGARAPMLGYRLAGCPCSPRCNPSNAVPIRTTKRINSRTNFNDFDYFESLNALQHMWGGALRKIKLPRIITKGNSTSVFTVQGKVHPQVGHDMFRNLNLKALPLCQT
jgi:hypothetical protein